MTDNREVVYDEAHWRLLNRFRGEAASLIKPLSDRHIEAIAYGSIARGDVNERSDIDIFVPHLPAPSILEALIEEAGTNIIHREIVQATPTYAAKGYIYSGERRGYSFSLVPMRPIEREFYGFAGSVNLKQLNAETRVPGVDKRLMLIDPTKTGHMESPIQGKEGTVAKKLGIGVEVVRDRVRTLKRRQRVGRTGVYIKRTLSPEESFGDTYRQLAQKKAPLRRRLRTNKK